MNRSSMRHASIRPISRVPAHSASATPVPRATATSQPHKTRPASLSNTHTGHSSPISGPGEATTTPFAPPVLYTAEQAAAWGAVNEVVDHEDLERVALEWAAEVNAKSPTSQRMLKFAFNLIDDGLVGQQLFAGEATRLAYMTDEAVEGRDAFLQKRAPDFSAFPRYF